MLQNSHYSITIIVLPQDLEFRYYMRSNGLARKTRLKNMIHSFYHDILSNINTSVDIPLAFENTTTIINHERYSASFYFERFEHGIISILTLSDLSKKPTTVKIRSNLYMTSLDITRAPDSVINFINSLFLSSNAEQKPAWLDDVVFSDDLEQRAIIEQNNSEIEIAKKKILAATEKLSQNDRYKSILYSNGDTLVSVVHEILDKMLVYDSSEFEDKKKEDFLIVKPGYTLIGEIKGISSNVKSGNVSQIDNHYHDRMDRLAEEGREEQVYQLLIINPLRDKPLSEREPIHERQIQLAERNGCLIIETKTLLKMFERFLQGQLSTADCERLFTTKTGLLKEEELTSIPDQDMSPYMI